MCTHLTGSVNFKTASGTWLLEFCPSGLLPTPPFLAAAGFWTTQPPKMMSEMVLKVMYLLFNDMTCQNAEGILNAFTGTESEEGRPWDVSRLEGTRYRKAADLRKLYSR